MTTVAIIGLGYVGLPLAIEFGRHYETIGLDVCSDKIRKYCTGVDPAGEVSGRAFAESTHLRFTDQAREIGTADFVIIAVPTPVDAAHRPDFGPLESASRACGRNMKRGTVVIYESTVYPGATEEICVPILEEASGLRWMTDFHVGYSPERINPGDKEHTLTRIVKVVSGDDAATLESVAALYGKVITAGVHRASSLKVAEAAKVIENAQRDLNIALMNELAFIFDRIGIDTVEVLEAAGTKWNFLNFRPGLVGGHCIGVDPYYLTTKAEMLGYHPQVILAGRKINDAMGPYIARRTIKEMIAAGFPVNDKPVVVLGLTFKENVPDLRNSKVIDLIRELESYGARVFTHDPIASPDDALREYGVRLVPWEELPVASAIVLAVGHREYVRKPFSELAVRLLPGGVFTDVKSLVDAETVRSAGFRLWRL